MGNRECSGLFVSAMTAVKQQLKEYEAVVNLDHEVLKAAYYPDVDQDDLVGAWSLEPPDETNRPLHSLFPMGGTPHY